MSISNEWIVTILFTADLVIDQTNKQIWLIFEKKQRKQWLTSNNLRCPSLGVSAKFQHSWAVYVRLILSFRQPLLRVLILSRIIRFCHKVSLNLFMGSKIYSFWNTLIRTICYNSLLSSVIHCTNSPLASCQRDLTWSR